MEHLSEVDRVERSLLAGVDQFGGEDEPRWVVELVESGRLPESRVDESVRRLLAVKFRLGLFDNPYVDEDAAEDIVGSAAFRAAGHRAQVASSTIVSAAGVALPVAIGTRVHSPDIDEDVIARAGLVPAEPEDAEVIVVRVAAPFEPRDRYLLESAFHAGTLEFPASDVERVRTLSVAAPVIVVVHLERPAILAPILPFAAAVVAVYGSSDAAVLEALTSAGAPRGVLPFDIPRSIDAIRSARSDVPGDTADPLFRAGV